MIRFLVIALMAATLSGCLGGFFKDEDNAEPPAPLTDIPDPLKVRELWSRGTGSGTGGQRLSLTPAVAGELVYTADYKGRISATEIESGRKRWTTDTDLPVSAGPAYADGYILVGSSEGDVQVLDETGEVLWVTRVSSEVLSAPIVAAGVVIVRSVDGRVAGLDFASGEPLWVFDQSAPVLTLRGTGQPLLVNGQVLVGFANGKLIALDPLLGTELWASRVAVPRGRSELERIVDIDSTPALYDDVVYTGSFQANVADVSAESGVVLWRRDMSVNEGLAVDVLSVFVTDEESQLWALDPSNGTALWRQSALRARSLTAPAEYGDYIVVGDFAGYVHWLAKEDGRILARRKVDGDGISSAPVVVDDTVYVLSNGGELAALKLKHNDREARDAAYEETTEEILETGEDTRDVEEADRDTQFLFGR